MSALVKHPLTSQRPQHPQPPGPAANHNSGRSYLWDHPEYGCVYKPASSRIQQDLASLHLLFSDLIEAPSLDRPLGKQTRKYL